MMALSIAQPYARLIVAGEKRVENRTWPPPEKYLGEVIAIHASKSRAWLGTDMLPDPRGLVFGALLGTVRVLGYFRRHELAKYIFRHPTQAWLWDHRHVHGPICWVFEDARAFDEPIPYRGQLGLFRVVIDAPRGAGEPSARRGV